MKKIERIGFSLYILDKKETSERLIERPCRRGHRKRIGKAHRRRKKKGLDLKEDRE